jgi:hypothetical protein
VLDRSFQTIFEPEPSETVARIEGEGAFELTRGYQLKLSPRPGEVVDAAAAVLGRELNVFRMPATQSHWLMC